MFIFVLACGGTGATTAESKDKIARPVSSSGQTGSKQIQATSTQTIPGNPGQKELAAPPHSSKTASIPELATTIPQQISKPNVSEIVPKTKTTSPAQNPASITKEGNALSFSDDKYFLPTRDGFGFGNFRGGSGSAEIHIMDLIDFYGEEGLCIEPHAEHCDPYPGVIDFLAQLNEVLENGLCYGFSAAATQFFESSTNIPELREPNTETYDLTRTEDLDRHIARWHSLQFTEEFRNVLDSYLAMSPMEIAEDLITQLTSQEGKVRPPMTLALYSSHGSHSVTPTAVARNEDGYVIEVYDSNWPGISREVNIDSGGVWTYQGAHENPAHESGIWEESGTGTMALIPHTLDDKDFHCFFCEKTENGLSGTGSVMILNSSDSNNLSISVTDSEGKELKKGHGQSISEIPGAKSYILPGAIQRGITILVHLPVTLDQFAVVIEDNDETEAEFDLFHAGPTHPTTRLQGRSSRDRDKSPIFRVSTTEPGTFSTIIDSRRINQVRQSSSKSTATIQFEENEIYESSFRNGLIDEVRIFDRNSGTIKTSLKESLEKIDLPLRPVINKDGIQFTRPNRELSRIDIPEDSGFTNVVYQNNIRAYSTSYSDGITGTFKLTNDGQIISSLGDRSSAIRYRDGSLIQSTEDGIVIHRDTKGALDFYTGDNGMERKINYRDEQTRSLNSEELKDFLDSHLPEREVGSTRSTRGANSNLNENDTVRPGPEVSESIKLKLEDTTRLRESLEKEEVLDLDTRAILDRTRQVPTTKKEESETRGNRTYTR